MIDRLTTRPLVQRGLGIATAGLLVAGTLLAPGAVHASGLPPHAVDDTVAGTEDTNVVFDASVLLANDTDPESDTLTVTAVQAPLDGTVQLVGTTITFHPIADDCGTDTASFTYDVSDGTNGPDIGLVHIDLACVNDAPVAHNDTEAGHQDDPLVMTDHDLVANDDDVDTDNNDLFIAGASSPTNGAVSYNGLTHDVTFTPTGGLCNPTVGGFTYTVSDGDKTDTAHVTVTLMCNGTNHDPVAANDFPDPGTEDTLLHITGASLLANDTDADGDTLSIVSLKNSIGGTAALIGGNVNFTPTANLCGTNVASFEYDVSDGTDGDDFGLVTLSFDCVNDPAIANPDSGAVDENSGPADYNVLGNDTDADGDPITLQSATVSATAGTASVVAGKVRYTPAAVFSGVATITYTISDSHVTSQGTLSVLVGEDNIDPVVATPKVAFGSGRVDDTAPLKISWHATDLGSGVKTYKVQARIGSGDWKTISNGKATHVTKDYPFKKDLTFRVKATDKVGNVSGWVQSATRRITRFKHTSGSVDYTGSWTKVVGAHKYAFTTGDEKSARLSFSARSVLYVAPKTSASGFVKVYVDGNLIGRFKLHSGSSKYGVIIARASWATSGDHRIKIVNDVKGDRTNLAAFITLK